MKKIATLIISILFVTGIPACIGDDCKGIKQFFDIEGIVAEPILRTSNAGDSILLQNDSVYETEYRIYCDFIVNYYGKATPIIHPFSVNTAYALDCASPGGRGSIEGIDTIYIISKNKLDPSFSDYDTINSNILVDQYANQPKTLEHYIKTNKTSIIKRDIIFKLGTKVQNKTQPHQFTIIIKLGNGEVHTATTAPVYFR